MSELNDTNTREVVQAMATRAAIVFGTFSVRENPTWEGLFSGDEGHHLEMFKSELIMLGHCVEARLQEIYAVEQTDYGT